jgi:hypothetical protein
MRASSVPMRTILWEEAWLMADLSIYLREQTKANALVRSVDQYETRKKGAWSTRTVNKDEHQDSSSSLASRRYKKVFGDSPFFLELRSSGIIYVRR